MKINLDGFKVKLELNLKFKLMQMRLVKPKESLGKDTNILFQIASKPGQRINNEKRNQGHINQIKSV